MGCHDPSRATVDVSLLIVRHSACGVRSWRPATRDGEGSNLAAVTLGSLQLERAELNLILDVRY